MAKSNLIAGLDIGSGKITAVSGYMNQETGKLNIVSGVSVPCAGLKNGIVTDLRQVSNAVITVINKLESDAKQDLRGLYIALRGGHLQSTVSHGVCNISRADKEINPEDVDRVISNALSACSVPDNYENVSVEEQEFIVEGQGGIMNPEGMDGTSLEVYVYVTSGLSSPLSNLRKAIARAEYRITGTRYGLMCLSEAVLTQEEKDSGVLLIDLGGETTSIGICCDGCLQYSKEFDVGCDLITSDIAYALHTSKSNALKIKEQEGLCFPRYNEEENEEEVKVYSADGKVATTLKRSVILDVILPRMQDIFKMVKESISEIDIAGYIPVGVLTGGGSSMPGIESLASQVFGLKVVRCGGVSKELVEVASEDFLKPEYTTAISLLLYVSKKEPSDGKKEPEIMSKSPIMKYGKKFFKSLINSDIFGG
jgi:cell division protein FtsA